MAGLSEFSLSALAYRCRRETERFFRSEDYDPGYCFEIFRLALAERDQDAWELVFDLYTRLVLSWVRKHTAFASCGEEDGYFLNRAFERLWSGLSPERFDTQASLPAVLDYLKLCVHSALMDHVRGQGPPPVDVSSIRSPSDPDPGPETMAANHDLWELLNSKMNNEQERCFLTAYFTLDLKPREVADEFPNLFKNVAEVYRTRENIINRLRRDSDLGSLFDG
jgi:hypothetical protein